MTLAACLLLVATGAGAAGNCPDIEFTRFDMPPVLPDTFSLDNFAIGHMFFNFEDTVVIDVFVLSDGAVCGIEPPDDLNPRIHRDIWRALRRCRFAPAMKDGRPVSGVAPISFTFAIGDLSRSTPQLVESPFWEASPLVRDLAEKLGPVARKDGQIHKYWYEGVRFVGDIPLAVYRKAVALVEEKRGHDLDLDMVSSHFVLASVTGPDMPCHIVIRINTCRYRKPNGGCEGGDGYDLRWADGNLELLDGLSVWAY